MYNEVQVKLSNFLDKQMPVLSGEGVAFASAARTATVSSPDITAYGKQGLIVIFDVTAVHASGSDVKCKIEGKDPASGKYYTILESASVITVSTNTYRVNTLLTASANLIAKDMMPETFRFTMTHANANSTTYSVGYILV